MARLLSISDYLGGADNTISIEMFPNDRKVVNYDFDTPITNYTFSADYQSILLDEVKYDRITGDINMADTIVIGYFDNYATVDNNNINVLNPTQGTVSLTIPADRYTGSILPNARTHVVMTVLSFEWAEGADITSSTKTRHRWAIIERYEPGVSIGDPENDAGFTAI